MNDGVTNPSQREPPSIPDVTETRWESVEKQDVLEYDAGTGTYQATFDRNTESVCTAVVSAVAVVSGTKPMELPPLASTIDTDALESLIGPPRGAERVTITFHGYEITLQKDGLIAVQRKREE